MDEKGLIEFIRSIGIDVHLRTKARGHQGFYRAGRIDISKKISQNRVIPTLIHEFAHYIHSSIEPLMMQNGGTIEVIFDDEKTDLYEKELLNVTKFVDRNSKCEKLLYHKKIIREKILEYENQIKKKYPKFKRSKVFVDFDKYIKTSDAKYLLKYDRIKLVKGFLSKHAKIYTISNIENDFKDMPIEFAAYIRLRSYQKKQARVSSKINQINKYYTKPAELFARFVEGLYIDNEKMYEIAPNSYKRFYELLICGYYRELSGIYELIPNKELNIL